MINVSKTKKYVVNVDFPNAVAEGGHKIHLNPYFGELDFDSREKIRTHYDPKISKSLAEGGPIYLDEKEVEKCLSQESTLRWGNKEVTLFRRCRICKNLPKNIPPQISFYFIINCLRI